MIIDAHGHYVSAPPPLQAYRGWQLMNQARPTKGKLDLSDGQLEESMQGSIQRLEERGTDRLLLSPQAAAMGHHIGSELISRYWTQTNNEVIHRICERFPERYIGVAQLPQSPGVSPKNCIDELERTVTEFGFVGCNINPDPTAGAGFTPSMADEWWYPLYEKMVELDVPGMVHATSTLDPALHLVGAHYVNVDTAAAVELLYSRLFDEFPTLKIIIPHGGGAVPFQWGRFQAINHHPAITPGEPERFEETVKKLYFDAAVYDRDAMEMLIRKVGVDRVLFASELMGTAGSTDPDTGKAFDDTKQYVDQLTWLSDEERQKLFEQNARQVFPRLSQYLGEPTPA
jgi:4-oxalmesaconate hydratase